jgi:hypothetical protein
MPSVQQHEGGWTWTRDRDLSYEPDIAAGEPRLEVAVLEPEWEGRGHPREWPVIREQVGESIEAAEIVADWSRYARDFAVTLPRVDDVSPPENLDRNDVCTWLLEHGRIEEGLSLYSIDLDQKLVRLVQGQPIHYELRQQTSVWAERLRTTLTRSAPWTLREVLTRYGVDSRGHSKPVRLFGLGAMKQVRKPSVFLVSSHDQLRLELRFSGAAQRVDSSDWIRKVARSRKRVDRSRSA